MANLVSVCSNLHRQNIKEGMIMWRSIFIGSLREWWKVKTSKYFWISQSSATGKLRKEDQTLALPITRKERLS